MYIKKLKSYIFLQLLSGCILVTSVLTYIIWLSQSLGFVELIINKGLTLGVWFKLTSLLLPTFLIIIFPISLFLTILFLYNKMINDKELIVAQASGVSHWELASPGIYLGLIVTLICFTLTLFFAPNSIRSFKELQWSVRTDASQLLLKEGAFNQIGKGLTVYVDKYSPEGGLKGILVHDKRDKIKSITLMAENGKIIEIEKKPKVVLINGNRQELTRGSGDLSVLYFDRYLLDIGLYKFNGDSRFTDNRERSTKDLFTLSETDGIKKRNIKKMRIEGHQRITNPILNITLSLIALTFMLKSSFNKKGQIISISYAVLLTILIEGAYLAFSSMAVKKSFLVPSLYLIVILPIVFCIIKIRPKKLHFK